MMYLKKYLLALVVLIAGATLGWAQSYPSRENPYFYVLVEDYRTGKGLKKALVRVMPLNCCQAKFTPENGWTTLSVNCRDSILRLQVVLKGWEAFDPEELEIVNPYFTSSSKGFDRHTIRMCRTGECNRNTPNQDLREKILKQKREETESDHEKHFGDFTVELRALEAEKRSSITMKKKKEVQKKIDREVKKFNTVLVQLEEDWVRSHKIAVKIADVLTELNQNSPRNKVLVERSLKGQFEQVGRILSQSYSNRDFGNSSEYEQKKYLQLGYLISQSESDPDLEKQVRETAEAYDIEDEEYQLEFSNLKDPSSSIERAGWYLLGRFAPLGIHPKPPGAPWFELGTATFPLGPKWTDFRKNSPHYAIGAGFFVTNTFSLEAQLSYDRITTFLTQVNNNRPNTILIAGIEKYSCGFGLKMTSNLIITQKRKHFRGLNFAFTLGGGGNINYPDQRAVPVLNPANPIWGVDATMRMGLEAAFNRFNVGLEASIIWTNYLPALPGILPNYLQSTLGPYVNYFLAKEKLKSALKSKISTQQ